MTLELSLLTILILLGAGLAAGTVAGFAGVGGGIVMVPVLLELFRVWDVPPDVVVHTAMATSLLAGCFNSASSAVRHHHNRSIVWRLVFPIFPASILGGMAASTFAAGLSGRLLEAFLGCVLIYGAVRLATKHEGKDHGVDAVKRRPWWQWTPVGLGVGIFAGLSGLAGGVVLVPTLSLLGRVPSRYLAGTSSGVVMFTSLAAAVGYMASQPPVRLGDAFVGHVNVVAALCIGVTAIPMAQVGGWLNKRVGGLWFRRVFSVLLMAAGVRLLLSL